MHMTPHKEDKKTYLFVEVKYTYISKKRKRICKLWALSGECYCIYLVHLI